MPSGLAQFVKGQGQDNNADPPSEKELARRRNLAASAKVQPTTFYKLAPAHSQVVHNRRTVPPVPTYVQPSRADEQDGRELFAGSVLSDSDDTTRDLGSPDIRGYQAMLSPQFGQKIGGRNGIEQDSEQGYPGNYGEGEEEHEYLNDEDALEEEPGDEDGHSRAFHLQTSTAQMDNGLFEPAIRLRDSQHFAEAEKLHNSKFSSSLLPPIHPGISGRFTAANNLAGDGRKHPNGHGGAVDARYKSHPQRNGQAIPDDTAGNESDEDIRQVNPQQQGQKHNGQLERPPRTRVAPEHHSHSEEQAGDRFRASEVESEYSGGSSEPSPSQHTPLANRQSRKQTPTSSQTGKRKKAALELDYDTDTLSTMKYSELKDQPFDSNPKAPPPIIPESLRGPEVSLEDHLEHFKDSEPGDQFSLFAHMPLDQWEQSGDWFLGRFGDIMSKLKDARRAKRDVSKTFEEELATQEEAVRSKAEGIQEVFRQMRAGGEGVLKGRAP